MNKFFWAAVGAVLALSGCGSSSNSTSSSGGTTPPVGAPYSVTYTRTTYGIPHIQANDYGSLGYGYGFVFAQDTLCTMMEEFVSIRGERSKYFGGTGTYSIPSVPVTANNVDSDFFFKLIADDTEVQFMKSGIEPDAATMIQGFTDGFNRYITELKANQHPGENAACATAPWVSTISVDDMYRRFIRLAAIGSSEALITQIANAAPPASGSSVPSDAEVAAALRKQTVIPALQRLAHHKFGSNMYAIGPELTDSGQPIVYGNPHFPWTGPERLYMVQLTMGDQMNIEGVSLYGSPVLQIGFNDNLAWSHTVSTAYRFTFYQLTLNSGNPLQYTYNGQTEDITPVPLSVDVLGTDGKTITTQNRTLYRSQYGPMLIIKQDNIPVLGWNKTTAFTLRDVNLENNRIINQYFDWNKATSFTQFKQLHASDLGVPWVNTAASGPGGDAYYGDISVVPNVPNSVVTACATPFYSALIASQSPGLPLLDGSKTSCQWGTDSDAPVAGIFGAGNLPTLEGGTGKSFPDWVANMNDSYWLTNPASPVTGYNRIIGDEGTQRSLRTRLGILQIQNRLAGTDGLAGNTFNLSNLEQIALSANVYSAQIGLSDVQTGFCVSDKAGNYNVSNACNSLAQWDSTANLTSIGLPVWQEFWNNLASVGNVPTTPFDVNDPVKTPSGVNTTLSGVQKAFYDAQTTVQKSKVGFNTPLSGVQHSAVNTDAGNKLIPIYGAEGEIGAFTVADTEGDSSSATLTTTGYNVDFGNSFIEAVTWDSGGVHADGFLSYSESTDPGSAHYSDFTDAYSQKQWYHFPFHPAEITAEQIGSPVVLTGNASN